MMGAQALAQGFQRRRMNKAMAELTPRAFMGDPQALQQMFQLNPEAALMIQNQMGASQKRSRQTQMDQLARDKFQFEKDKFAQEKIRFEAETAAEASEQESAGPFEGKGAEMQAYNMLTRGVEDPEFRETPQYALAWQKVTEPRIIRTPTGDRLLVPEIDPMFKPPSFQQAVEAGLPGAPKKSRIIPGTEKISSDQKSYNKDYSILKKSFDSIQNYMTVMERLGPQISLGPINSADTQRILSAYTRMMLDVKTTADLGALQGPDMVLMENFLGDPTTLLGMAKGKESLLIGAGEAMRLITDNHSSLNSLVEGQPVNIKKLGKKRAKKEALEFLRANPETIDDFEEFYGYRPEGF